METLKNKILDENYDWGNQKFDSDTFDELMADLIIDYLKKHGPEERHKLIICWNFDNPKEVIQWIIEQNDTDKATALLIYWMMQPGFSKQFQNRDECASWYLEDYDIIQTIEHNYLSNFYQQQQLACDPKNDIYSNGYDWTSDINREKMKVPIPEIMFTPLIGTTVENPHWSEGIPDELQPVINRLCDLND